MADEEIDQDDLQDLDEEISATAAEESEEVQEDESLGVSRRRRYAAAAGERREPVQLWLISYSDFMTILFIFFLAMFSYASMNQKKLAGASISYEAFSKLMAQLQTQVGDRNMNISEDKNKITVRLKDKVLFPSGSADLTSEARATLAELAKSVKLVEGDVIVQGHTDNVPVVGGRYKSNWELSAARAFSVIQAMAEGGVPQKRLAAWGFGENRPIEPNNKEENRIKNRRIEVIIFKMTQNGKGV